jgi:Protein of unknown function (DUF2004)
MALNEVEIKNRKDIALAAIKAVFGTEEDEYGATEFVSHHLEELDAEYWKKHLGTERPSPNKVLEILVLRDHWDEDCVFDFTLPEEVTDYVISVRFNEEGEVEEITMES